MPVGNAAAARAGIKASKNRTAAVGAAPRPATQQVRAPQGTSTSSSSALGREKKVRSQKVIFLGNQGVGKTSIIRRFLHDTFEDTYKATVGIDFVSKELRVDDRAVKLQLWDTAGQERFRALIPGYLRDTAACLIVYDVTCRASFDAVHSWVEDVRRECGEDNLVLAIVGNKTDLEDTRQVSSEEGLALSKELHTLFSESSARTGSKVIDIFEQIARALPEERTKERDAEDEDFSLAPAPAMDSRIRADSKACAC